MAEIKYTLQDKFAATIALLEGNAPEMEWNIGDAIAFLNDRAEKAKSKPHAHKTKPETIEFRATVLAFLETQTDPMTAKEIGNALGESVQKTANALRFLAGEGQVTAHPGEKARDAKTYEMTR